MKMPPARLICARLTVKAPVTIGRAPRFHVRATISKTGFTTSGDPSPIKMIMAAVASCG